MATNDNKHNNKTKSIKARARENTLHGNDTFYIYVKGLIYTCIFKSLPPAHTTANRHKYLQSVEIQFDYCRFLLIPPGSAVPISGNEELDYQNYPLDYTAPAATAIRRHSKLSKQAHSLASFTVVNVCDKACPSLFESAAY